MSIPNAPASPSRYTSPVTSSSPPWACSPTPARTRGSISSVSSVAASWTTSCLSGAPAPTRVWSNARYPFTPPTPPAAESAHPAAPQRSPSTSTARRLDQARGRLNYTALRLSPQVHRVREVGGRGPHLDGVGQHAVQREEL